MSPLLQQPRVAPAVCAALALVIATVLVRLLASKRLARLVLDIPNDRSLHDKPIPRTGGIGLILAAGTVWLALVAGHPAIWTDTGTTTAIWAALSKVVAPLAGVLALIFLVDDVRGLAVPVRFGAQTAAAAGFIALTGPYPLLLMPLLVVGIVWSTNLYNFMDGSNGLAGGMAVAGFGTYAIAAALAGATELACAAGIIAGAAGGFLVWNFDPARIFLGDAGSIPLGFLAAVLGVLGWQHRVWPFWLPVLAFSPFIVDACVTLVQRWRRGERLSEAHKSHYYQRLVRMGWSHRQLALAAYCLMLAAGISALTLRAAHPVTIIGSLAAWCVAYVAISVWIDRRWRAFAPGAEPAPAAGRR